MNRFNLRNNSTRNLNLQKASERTKTAGAATPAASTTPAKFDFAALKDVFLKEGLDALLNKLKELKTSGVVDKITVKTDSTTGKTTVSVEVDGVEYEFTGVQDETSATSPKTEPPAVPTVPSQPDTSDNNGDFDNSVTLESGIKSEHYLIVGNKIYYFNTKMDLLRAKLMEDPAKIAVGTGTVEQHWGERTQYFIISGDNKFYFASRIDYEKAKWLTVEEQRKLAVGCFPVENKGDESVKSDSDAVTEIRGKKTEYYIDVEGTRFYYPSADELMHATVSNNPYNGSCGQGEVMTEWGKKTDYYIDYKGKRYYFRNESDKQVAQAQLDMSPGAWGIMQFNKFVIGKE